MKMPHFFDVRPAIDATASHPVPLAVTTSVTPEDGPYVMPGSAAGPTAVPEAYAPLLSAACPSWAVARLRRSPFIVAKYAFSLVLENFGIAMAARMLMMTTTI